MKHWWAKNPQEEDKDKLVENGNVIIITTDHQIQKLLTQMALDPKFKQCFQLIFPNSADWHLLAQVYCYSLRIMYGIHKYYDYIFLM